jgi:hypothetical protein
VRWEKMALLVLRRVGLCFGQNQMCHLCGGNKIELKKCAVGQIKNTEGSAMSVGLLVVCLQYGLYVVHLSKWFVFVLLFKFWSVVVFGTVFLPLAITVCGFAFGRNF